MADENNNNTPSDEAALPDDLRRLLDRAQASDEGEDVYDETEGADNAEDDDDGEYIDADTDDDADDEDEDDAEDDEEDEDGKEYELEVLAELEHNGSRYLALVPAGSGNDDEEEDLEVSILKSVEENGEEFLEAIEDDAELEEVYSALMDLIYEEDDAPEA